MTGTVQFKDGHIEEVIDINVVDSSLVTFKTKSGQYALMNNSMGVASGMSRGIHFYKMQGPDDEGHVLFAYCHDIQHVDLKGEER